MLKLCHKGTGDIFYATTHSAGFDLCANEDTSILPSQWKLIKTGLFIEESSPASQVAFGDDQLSCIPEMQIRPRSGLAAKFGITVLNSPSTIDADYRGEIMVTLINHSQNEFKIQKGDRIAQGVCALVVQLKCVAIKSVERGSQGFGSTGK